jgi:hypothetical protein
VDAWAAGSSHSQSWEAACRANQTRQLSMYKSSIQWLWAGGGYGLAVLKDRQLISIILLELLEAVTIW